MKALAATVTTTTTMIATMKYAPILILVADFIVARLKGTIILLLRKVKEKEGKGFFLASNPVRDQ